MQLLNSVLDSPFLAWGASVLVLTSSCCSFTRAPTRGSTRAKDAHAAGLRSDDPCRNALYPSPVELRHRRALWELARLHRPHSRSREHLAAPLLTTCWFTPGMTVQ